MADEENKLEQIQYEDLKQELLTITGVDEDDDEQLKVAYSLASRRIYGIVAGFKVDTIKFEAVCAVALQEMTIYRFNRISEEGMKSRSQDGESIVWEDPYDEWEQKVKATIISDEPEGWILKVAGSRETSSVSNMQWVMPMFNGNLWLYSSQSQPYQIGVDQTR